MVTLHEYQTQLIGQHGFCASCLGNLNSTVNYRARWTDEEGQIQYDHEGPSTGAPLLEWAVKHFFGEYGETVIFESIASGGRLVPIVVVGGTPLCEACNYAYGVHSQGTFLRWRGR